MKFTGQIETQSGRRPIHFEIGEPRPSARAAFECPVRIDYPRELDTVLYGVDEGNAYASAVKFVRALIGECQLLTAAGAPVSPLGPSHKWSAEARTVAAPGERGLVVSVRALDEGRIRLVVEQVTRAEGGWKDGSLTTYKDFDGNKLSRMDLSSEEYAEVGFNLLVTLLAERGLLKL
jgi:hypothetical protein